MSFTSKEEKFTSKHGIAVYTYPNPSLHSFHLSLYVRAGSMHEKECEHGIAHFFEHAAIRNVNRKRGGELYSELDRRGVEFNASTYSELVHFYVSGSPACFDFAAGVLLDVLSPIVLSKREVDEERSRIKAEMRESDERSSLSSFTGGIVHESTSLAHSITGSPSSVNKITKTRLEEFRRRTLCAENIFIYATGNVTEDNVRALLSLLDAVEMKEGVLNSNVAPVSKNFFKRETKVYIKNADFTMARFTFDLDMSDMSLAETDLIYDVLLSGYNSEFFIELSENRGMLYDVSGALERYNNIGTLSFSFEIREAELYRAVEVVCSILAKLKREPLPEDRCMRATYVDNAYMLLDDPRELNFTFAYDNHVMNAGYMSLEDRIAAYSSVTSERIRKLAVRIFRRENLTFTMKGRKRRIDEPRLLCALASIDENDG